MGNPEREKQGREDEMQETHRTDRNRDLLSEEGGGGIHAGCRNKQVRRRSTGGELWSDQKKEEILGRTPAWKRHTRSRLKFSMKEGVR